MPGLIELLFAYGLAFGLMNKLPDALYQALPRALVRLLACSYCTGFHTGWIAYAFLGSDGGIQLTPVWALCSAAFTYAADAMIRLAERLSDRPDRDHP